MKKELSTYFNTRQYMHSKDFEIFYYNDPRLNSISSHSHPYYEFYFFMEGDLSYSIDGKQYPLERGDYLLIPPGIMHGPVFHTTNTQAPYRRFVLWLSEAYYSRLCQFSNDFSYSFDFSSKNQRYHFRTDFIIQQELQGKLMDLIEEINGNKPFGDLSARLMVCSFITQINKITYNITHQVSYSYENVLYLNICDYINNHLDQDLTLDSLAAFFYVSKYHISHVFKNNMGISPHQYILKKRLQASKNGILSGSPLKNIFAQYGFNDYTSFYRAFKKEFALSPKEFKEQHELPDYI